MAEQLGLEVLVQPEQVGPFSFGSATYVSIGPRTRPGAISLTSIRVHSAAEAEEVRNRGQMAEALKEAGDCNRGARLPEHPPYWELARARLLPTAPVDRTGRRSLFAQARLVQPLG